ncbi:MAG: glycosyl hydrolase family 2 [Tannerella sp.]|jgi:hypothetical protein|nr:glycosyl hydrolase family 2 [Tannerella sp.]
MKKIVVSFIVILLSGVYVNAREWPAAQPDARPATRWWWLGSAVDKANLTYNLEKYSQAGIGRVEITPIYGVQGNEANDLQFLSPQWMQMLQHTRDEGKRLNIRVDMNTGTGWPFGGPNVSIEDAATKAVFREYSLQSGQQLSERIEPEDEKQRPVAKLSRLMAYSSDGKILNLTNKAKDGSLQWTAPEGQWRLIALFEGKTFQRVKRAAPGGEGYVMNHFSAKATDHYLANFDKSFKTNNTSYPHTFFNDSYEVYGADWTPGFLEEFARRRGYKFEEYLPLFLDTTNIDGKRPEATTRIISDYRETLSDLLKENFTCKWTAWAHRHGSKTRNQAHGSPGNLIDLYALVDIPECEGFGLSEFHIDGLRKDSLTRHNDSDLSMLKYASSAAHISGKPYTSSETFTWLTEHFRTSLSQCKPDIDLLFVSGVNHVFFHGTPYSPREAEWPGWLFYASVNMSPTNTIWRDAPAFFEYITRCQSFLQKGQPDNDFLLYLPIYDIWNEQPGRFLAFDIHKMKERAPKFIDVVNNITQSGYDVDYISDDFIRSTRCQDGRLVTSGGVRYKALIIPATRLMPADVLNHLLKLAGEGADIVFAENYPQDVPGYGNSDKKRQAFKKAAGQLPEVSFERTTATTIHKGRIITGKDYAATLAQCKAVPEEMKTKHGLQYIRRSDNDGYHYFIAALHNKNTEDWITLSTPATSAAIYDPVTGTSGMAQTRQKDGKTQVYLQLRSGESLIVKTYKEPAAAQNTPEKADKNTIFPEWNYYTDQPVSLSLDHGWTLRFIESEPEIKGVFAIDHPVSWTTIDNPDAKRNNGTALYSVSVTLPPTKADDWILDLGDVRESAQVKVNGQYVGTCWAVPFRIHVGDYLNEGTNLIEIEVTNLPANRIADFERRGVNWRIFKEINLVDLSYRQTGYGHWETMPSGLNSTVKLIPANRINPQ